MGKISIVSAKYIIHATIKIDGVVDRPDVIGAIFGQTEGLLGADLELRELQRGGRIGRIEVKLETKGGKSEGSLIIPSSLDKAETAIIGAALEVIERIGPCDSKITVDKIEDVRVSKRKYIIDRAKTLLSNLMDRGLPDSQEIAEQVSQAVRVMEIQSYGREKLAAGPSVNESDEIIVVEGRADVVNMLKHGFKNTIAMNGSSVPQTIVDLSKKKTITVFVDGDRGGHLNIKQLLTVAEIDFVAIAPDGKEVEELTKKEIHKCLRSKVTAEQFSLDHHLNFDEPEESRTKEKERKQKSERNNSSQQKNKREQSSGPIINKRKTPPTRITIPTITKEDKEQFKNKVEDLIGSKAAYILDKELSVLGKLPLSELTNTVKELAKEVYAIVLDGSVTQDLADVAEESGVGVIVGLDKEKNLKTSKTLIKLYDEL